MGQRGRHQHDGQHDQDRMQTGVPLRGSGGCRHAMKISNSRPTSERVRKLAVTSRCEGSCARRCYAGMIHSSKAKFFIDHSCRIWMRPINLRQIEAFKAVIENGTISRAALMLHISQPAMSKLIAHMEADTGLRLFDRLKGRVAPTEQAMRLYEEVDRIFAGVRQVANAVDAIRREAQGRLAVGVMPALAGSFIQRATSGFLQSHPNVFCLVQSLSSQWVVDRMVMKKLDFGVVSAGIDNP